MIELGLPLIPSNGLCFIDGKDRFSHLYCLGATRSGKTNFILGLAKQEFEYCMLILDPAGTFAPQMAYLAPKDRLLFIDKDHPICINPLGRSFLPKAERVTEFCNAINASVKALNPMQVDITPKMKNIIMEAVKIFEEKHMRLDYLANFLDDWGIRQKHFRKYGSKSNYWKKFDGELKGFSRDGQELRASASRVTDRIKLITDNETLSAFMVGKDEFNLFELTEQKKIICFNLNGMFDDYKRDIGNFVTQALKSYEVYANPKAKKLFFYCDEFHLFLNKDFKGFLTACGKNNISVNLTHHDHSQIDEGFLKTVLTNCYTKVVLRIEEDAERMASSYQLTKKDFLDLGEYEAHVKIGNKTHKVLTFYTPVESYTPPTPVSFLRDDWIML